MHAHHGSCTCQYIYVLLALSCMLLTFIFLPTTDLQYSVHQLSLLMHSCNALFTPLLSGAPENVKGRAHA